MSGNNNVLEITKRTVSNAGALPYTPVTEGDWPDPDPVNVGEGLDGLAGRVTVLEADIGEAFEIIETPTPAPNGAVVLFTLANAYRSGSLRVYRNGLHQGPVAAGNFVQTSPALGTFTTTFTPATGEDIYCVYAKD